VKRFLQILLLLVISFGIRAQTNITTWYIIAPTNGCNGVWAMDYSQATCGQSFLLTPNGCANWNATVVADTIFWPLCSLPCDLTVCCDSLGNACAVCSTGFTTGTNNVERNPITTTYPNPTSTSDGWNILFQHPEKNVEVKIFNSIGELVAQEKSENTPEIFHVNTNSLSMGTYSVEVRINESSILHEKLIITR
jgi:hypothetical protein